MTEFIALPDAMSTMVWPEYNLMLPWTTLLQPLDNKAMPFLSLQHSFIKYSSAGLSVLFKNLCKWRNLFACIISVKETKKTTLPLLRKLYEVNLFLTERRQVNFQYAYGWKRNSCDAWRERVEGSAKHATGVFLSRIYGDISAHTVAPVADLLEVLTLRGVVAP